MILMARQRSAARIIAPNMSFQHRLLAEGIRDDLRTPPLLDEQPLGEVGGANRPTMRNRQPQMGDAQASKSSRKQATARAKLGLVPRGR
ncbi:MAG: hypothetical protein H6852_05310 [Geminicoccaceae bacterium]|nr:hypothetical protein [Geminicoccaceae bacterium]